MTTMDALTFVILYVSIQVSGAVVSRNDRIWPIGGSSDVDLPQSSPFGPRLHISQGNRYDFHRGVDIPCDLYSNVYAIANGTVRINGSHPLYSDGVVQLRHEDWEENPESVFYSNYIHIVLSNGDGESITLTNGQPVQKGDLIAYSYRTASLDHIHFEIRVGDLFQANACNPWKYLPNNANDYSSFEATLNITPNYNDIDCEAVVNVSVAPDQLTFTRVELHIIDSSDQPQEVRFFDMCGANSNHSLEELDMWEYQDDPGNSSTYIIRISPTRFNSQSYGKNESAGYGFEFLDLPPLSGSGKVMAKIFDVFDNSISTEYVTYTCSDGDDNDDGDGGDGDDGDGDDDDAAASAIRHTMAGIVTVLTVTYSVMLH